jgi:peptidoglycan-N-acetylmuramic acid deacetylase
MRSKKQKTSRLLFMILVVMAASVFSPLTKAAAQSGDWGLYYPKHGETPQGNEKAEDLLELDAYFAGDPAEKTLYLTFDAGFENGQTERILDVLKENDVPAAFFLVGTYIRDHAELVRRMVEEGQTVANHTMSHPDMSAIADKAAFEKELVQTEAVYEEVTGQKMPKYYRPPRGKYSKENMRMAKELGYKTIFWSVAYVDWHKDKQPSKAEAFGKLMPRTHPGAVLLLHSTSETNANILDELIKKYKEMGYEFKDLDDLTK